MPVQAQTLLTEIRYELKDSDSTVFTDAELLSFLSDAVDDIVRNIAAKNPRAWLATDLTQLDTQDITSGEDSYPLPDDLYQVIEVTLENSDGDTSIATALDFARTFDTAADGYFERNGKLYVYPTPDATVTDGLNIYYIPRVSRISALTTNITLGDTFRAMYKEYVVIKAKSRQSESTAEFAGLFGRLEAQLDSMTARKNLGRDTRLRTPGRNWI